MYLDIKEIIKHIKFVPPEILQSVNTHKIRGCYCVTCRKITKHTTGKTVNQFIEGAVKKNIGDICLECGTYFRFYSAKLTKQIMNLALDNYECVYCGCKEGLTIDHVIPKVKGGTNHHLNLVTSCQPCNQQKDKNDAPEFKFGRFKSL